MVRLVVKNQKLQIIFQTILDAIPRLSGLGVLLLLSIYIFSVIGVHSFALLKLEKKDGLEGELDKNANF